MDQAIKTKWVIDPNHSEIGFKVKHLMITNVKGIFKDYDADVTTDGDDFGTAQISLRIRTASVDTGVADRDGHLRSADFFDSENHSEITFRSEKLVKTSGDEFSLSGHLTIRGISRPVTLAAEYAGMMTDPWGNRKAGFVLSGRINRKDWDLNWNAALEAGGFLVGDEVKLNCEVQLVRQS